MSVLSDVTTYSLVDRYQCFEGISCVLFRDRGESHAGIGSNIFKPGRKRLPNSVSLPLTISSIFGSQPLIISRTNSIPLPCLSQRAVSYHTL